jgi:hypothetical protein
MTITTMTVAMRTYGCGDEGYVDDGKNDKDNDEDGDTTSNL